MEQASSLVSVIGMLAFIVSAITQATKNLPGLQRIPTDAQVIALSLLFTLLAVLAYAQLSGLAVRWYLIAAVLPLGLLVSFVAMYGWATARDLWQRLALREGEEHDEAQSMIKIARSQLGYAEAAGNRSKYGAWYGLDGQPWCMMFISWCAAAAGISADTIPQLASCPQARDWFQLRGRFHSAALSRPEPGDVVFFDHNGNGVADHAGLAERVEGNTLACIEGNQGDAVRCRSYPLSAPGLLGYGRPAYAAEEAADAVHIRLEDSGRMVTVSGFLRAGVNYIRLRDMERLFPVRVGYDATQRLPTLRLNYMDCGVDKDGDI